MVPIHRLSLMSGSETPNCFTVKQFRVSEPRTLGDWCVTPAVSLAAART
jgi:hypothetical protein